MNSLFRRNQGILGLKKMKECDFSFPCLTIVNHNAAGEFIEQHV